MRELSIAYRNSRSAKQWSNKTIRFGELKERTSRLPAPQASCHPETAGTAGAAQTVSRRSSPQTGCTALPSVDNDFGGRDCPFYKPADTVRKEQRRQDGGRFYGNQ